MSIGNYLHAFLDIFYPRTCSHCNHNLNNSLEFYICSNCRGQISYITGNQCIRCGTALGPHTIITGKKGCTVCREKSLYFDAVTSITYYEGVVKTLLHKFKYARQKFLSAILIDIILRDKRLYDIVPNVDMIIPVPLHWLKKMRRGFNQSELLSQGVQKLFLKPISRNNLCRIKNTVSQTRLSKNQRQINVRNAFFIKRPELLKGKRILLIDDVLTTGVTASECSKKLKEAGVQSVHLLILAAARL